MRGICWGFLGLVVAGCLGEEPAAPPGPGPEPAAVTLTVVGDGLTSYSGCQGGYHTFVDLSASSARMDGSITTIEITGAGDTLLGSRSVESGWIGDAATSSSHLDDVQVFLTAAISPDMVSGNAVVRVRSVGPDATVLTAARAIRLAYAGSQCTGGPLDGTR